MHPLCLTMGTISLALESLNALPDWRAAGGTFLLHAQTHAPADHHSYGRVSFHHPGHRPEPLNENAMALAMALLALEGYRYKGMVNTRGATTLTGRTPSISHHQRLDAVTRIKTHLDTLGWTAGIENDPDFQFTLSLTTSKSVYLCA